MTVQFKGKVTHGLKLGRKLGFPTANIQIPANLLPPGTYLFNAILGKKIWLGVGAYIEEKGVFEAHIFDFNKNIYGKEIEIILLKKIRDNQKFESLELLKKQIEKDVIQAKKEKIIGLTFGTFDVIHKGHKHYLFEARKYCTYLVTIIARDINVLKIKGKFPRQNETQRKKNVQKMNLSDKVIFGDKKDPLKKVLATKPSVICLGYDQRGFSEKLSEPFIKEQNIEIITISPFQEKKYKSSIIKARRKV